MSYLQWWVQVRVPVSGGQLSSLQIVGGEVIMVVFCPAYLWFVGGPSDPGNVWNSCNSWLLDKKAPTVYGWSLCCACVNCRTFSEQKLKPHRLYEKNGLFLVSAWKRLSSAAHRTGIQLWLSTTKQVRTGLGWVIAWGGGSVWAQLGTTQPTHPEVTGWLDVATSFQGEGVGLTQH